MAKKSSNLFLDWYNSGALTLSNEQRKVFKKQAKALIEEAEKRLAVDDKDYLALFQLAMGYFSTLKRKEAIPYYEKALEIKEEPRLLFYYAYCLALAKQGLEKAEGLLEKLPDEYQKEAAFYNVKGKLAANKTNFERAIEAYNKAIEIDPADAVLWNNKGTTLQELKRYKEAITAYDQAIAVDPEYVSAWISKGNALADLERYEEAIAAFDKAITLDPKHAIAWYNKGTALYDSKRFEEAIAAYDQAIDLDPEYVDALNNKGTALFKLEHYEKAIETYDQAIKLDQDDKTTWYNKGLALNAVERYEEAVTAFNLAIEIDPEFVQAWNSIGNALSNLKRYEDALECYQQVIQYGKDLYKELARQEIEDLEAKIKIQGYADLEETINQIEKHLSHEPEAICHYTRQQTSYLILLCIEGKHDTGDQKKVSPFQLSAGSFLNDSSEGQILETFLGIDTGNVEQSNYESTFAAKPIIGSFVPAELYNDLNLWRMYGDGAKGCSITFRLDDFQQALYDQLSKPAIDKEQENEGQKKVQDKRPKEQFPCYWVAYYDPKKDTFCIPGQEGLEEKLNKLMVELKDRYKEMRDKNEEKNDSWIQVTKRLNEIAYLFKLSEYKAEQEIRLIVNPGLFPKQFEFGHGWHRVYMSTVPIRNLTTRICLGPKLPEANRFASLLHHHFEQDPKVKDTPEIILSHLPYQ